jgi:hypothetical protein
MKDKFGNPLHEGDTVVYFSTDLYHTSHIGIYVEEVPWKGVKLISEKGNPIHRPANTLIAYTGINPNA